MSSLRYPNLLVLFDIDGTLLLSNRAGARAMLEALTLLRGAPASVDGVEFAGRLDPDILRALADRNGLTWSEERLREARAFYARILNQHLSSTGTAFALPGVKALLKRIRSDASMVPGILTGNFPETGAMKLQAAGLDPEHFLVAAWGDDGSGRRDLPGVAMRRFRELTGHALEPHRVVVIGDTPLDIDCARANGCRAVAVATGTFSLETLSSHNPDLLLSDLTGTRELFAWLMDVARG